MIRLICFCLTLAGMIAFPVVSRAQNAEDVVQLRLLPGWRTADGTHMSALEIALKPGWKTYWRAPGDAGIPPQFDWRGSRNVQGFEVIWPTPEVLTQGGFQTVGYHDLVILPLQIIPQRRNKDITLSGTVSLGVCEDICIPVEIDVSASLPRNHKQTDPRIAAALVNQPYSAAEARVSSAKCQISAIDGGLGLKAVIDMPSTGGKETAIIEVSDPQVWIAQAKTVRSGGQLIVQTKLYHVEGRSFLLDRSGIRITVLGRSHAVDIQGCTAG